MKDLDTIVAEFLTAQVEWNLAGKVVAAVRREILAREDAEAIWDAIWSRVGATAEKQALELVEWG